MAFEDDLEKRKQLARLQGWSEEEINRSALIERSLESKRAAQQPKAPQGAGRAGGIKGFALDITPFGRVAEKIINPGAGNVTAGEVGMEAALTAVPFGIGRIFKGAKATKSAVAAAQNTKRVANASGVSRTTAKAAQPSPEGVLPNTPSGLFTPREGAAATNVGRNVRGYGRGIQSGTRPEGAAERLTPAQARSTNTLLDQIGAKGSVPQQIDQVERIQQQTGDIILQTVSQANKATDPKQLRGITARVKQNILGQNGSGVPGFRPELHNTLVASLGRQMASAKDTIGLENFRKSLDDIINYSRNPNSPDPLAERIAQAFRREVDAEVTRLVPEAKQAKGLYGRLEGAKDALIVNSPMTLQQTAGTGGLFSKLFSSGATQRLLSGTGRAIQFAATPAGATAGGQAGVRIGADLLGLRPDGQAGQDQQLPADPGQAFGADQQLIDQAIAGGANDFDSIARMFDAPTGPPEGAAAPEAAGMQYSSAQLNQAAQAAALAGDMASYKVLATLADDAVGLEKAQAQAAKAAGGGKLSAEASKVVANANSGLESLAQLEAMISQGGVPKGTVVPGRNLLGGLGASQLGTSSYDTAARNIKDVITRLRTGAAITENEERFYNAQLPQAFDPPETVQQKLMMFRQLFESVASRTGSPSLSEDLGQLFSSSQQYAY